MASATASGGWSSIDPRLVAALRERSLGSPTEIQRLALPVLASDDDVLLVAPTGTGKTEAALVPILSRRLSRPSLGVTLLYVTPLRALNRDLEHRLVSLVESVGLTAAVRHGDTPQSARTRQSRNPPDLLLTTPETLQLLLVGTRLRTGLTRVRDVIVDEVHELFPSDRGAQLALSLERLDKVAGRPVRRIGLSATIGNPVEVARFLSPEPRTVEVRVAGERREMRIRVRVPPATLPKLDPLLREELKADDRYLAALLVLQEEVRSHRTTLVFVNTRPTAEGIAARLHRLAPDLPIAVHHGSLSRDVREEAERQFRLGELKALVSTSSLELGIDVGSVDLVVQFGSPHQAGRLLQRVGRAGHRLDRVSEGVLLALDDDDLEEGAVLARRALAGDLEPTRWRTRNRLAAAQQIIATLRAEGTAEAEAVSRRLRHAAPTAGLSEAEWAALVDYLEQLGSLRQDHGHLRPGRGTLNRFYSTLSLIPEERTYRLRDIATRKPIGTLDERFVLTQVLGQPELIFLLHGRTWRVVEFREGELLVETVSEIGREPRWVGEDLPVPYEAAQEIGRLRREKRVSDYPVDGASESALVARLAPPPEESLRPTDARVTVTVQGRIVVVGACAGNRTNATLALAAAGLLTARLGAQTEILAVEPTWFVLGLPIGLDPAGILQTLAIPPTALEDLVTKLVPSGFEYRYVFITVARKLGVIPVTADPRELKSLEPLMQSARNAPLGEEALEKTLHDRFDVPHARELLARIESGEVALVLAPPNRWTDLVLERLRWQELSEAPPPTLLRAVRDRLRQEPLTLVCLRCGFTRTTTATRYAAEGGSRCRICHGALSAVISPRRPSDVDDVSQYARRKWKGRRALRSPPPALAALVRAGYTTAELLAQHGERALLVLAGRGIGPETARRLLARMYRSEDELMTEVLRAERSYARTRAFWD